MVINCNLFNEFQYFDNYSIVYLEYMYQTKLDFLFFFIILYLDFYLKFINLVS